jgi:hypothetical protein
MSATRCAVSFEDNEGIRHSVEVQADSLYEAVAVGIAAFREDPMVPHPAPMTELMVSIERPRVEHHIRLSQVQKWAESTTKEGPAGMTKRQRVRALLGVRAY